MSVYFWEGQLLFRNGQLAKSNACCCSCCDCPRVTHEDTLTAKITVTTATGCASSYGGTSFTIPLQNTLYLPGNDQCTWNGSKVIPGSGGDPIEITITCLGSTWDIHYAILNGPSTGATEQTQRCDPSFLATGKGECPAGPTGIPNVYCVHCSPGSGQLYYNIEIYL